MAILEMWWDSTDIDAAEGIALEPRPGGYALQGALDRPAPLVLTAHYLAAPTRMNFGNPRCVSQPVALFSGELQASTRDSRIGDGDPRITVKHTLRQRVYLGGRQIGHSDREVVVVDVKGDDRTRTVVLAPLAFDPVTFSAVAGTELRIDLVVELDPAYHHTRPGGATYQGTLQLPQWGVIHGV